MLKYLKNHPNIPPEAIQVFEGKRSLLYQWDQKLYDGSLARFEKVQLPDGAFVIPVLPSGKILLIKQEQPRRTKHIGIPGGGVDTDDSDALAGAQRELLEETGYISEHWSPWFQSFGSAMSAGFTSYFIAHACKKASLEERKARQQDPGEKIELFEVSFEEFLALSSDKNFSFYYRDIALLLYEARLFPEKECELKKLLFPV